MFVDFKAEINKTKKDMRERFRNRIPCCEERKPSDEKRLSMKELKR